MKISTYFMKLFRLDWQAKWEEIQVHNNLVTTRVPHTGIIITRWHSLMTPNTPHQVKLFIIFQLSLMPGCKTIH